MLGGFNGIGAWHKTAREPNHYKTKYVIEKYTISQHVERIRKKNLICKSVNVNLQQVNGNVKTGPTNKSGMSVIFNVLV